MVATQKRLLSKQMEATGPESVSQVVLPATTGQVISVRQQPCKYKRYLSVSAGLELASDKWAWYWYLVLAVVCDLALAAIVYASYRWWSRRHNAQTAAALQQSKLGTAAAPTGGRAPVYMTASAAAGQAVSNPYYNRSFTPAPGLQQPLRSTYAYPGAY